VVGSACYGRPVSETPGGDPGGPADPVVSIIIPVLDRVDLLLGCLDSLAQLVEPCPRETIVVANGTDPARLPAMEARDDITLVRSVVNLGFGGGCNWGARRARGRYLVFLNDDTEAETGWLSALLRAAGTDERIGAVGSRLAGFDGTLQEVGGVLWSDGGTHRLGRGLAGPAAGSDEVIRDVDYSSGCGLLVTRDAWEAVGGFDPGYYPGYHEDVDLCLAVRSHGYRTVVVPAARLRHHEGASTDEAYRALAARRSGLRFIAKWAEALQGYEPHPDPPLPGRVEAAVEAALRRTAERPLPPRIRARSVRQRAPSQDEGSLLRLQVGALLAALELKDARIALLTGEVARLRPEHEKLERLRRFTDRLPFAHRLARRLTARLPE
jgi:GT2 family glycosyltransferase